MTDQRGRPGRGRLTLRDVSEASGVSEMTVSRVLRGRGEVSERTRARVLEAARRLGYVPNRIAGALASQHVNLVGVIVPSISNMVYPEVLHGISSVLDGTELQPLVGFTAYDEAREERVIYDLLSWRPSGLILAGLEHSPASRAMLAGAGIPVVEVMDTDGDPVDVAVGISHLRAGRMMAEAVLAAGYRRVALLGTRMNGDHRAAKRLQGFADRLREAGLSPVTREYYEGGSSLAKGRAMTAAVLERAEVDFLYYANDMIAAGGLLELLDRGIAVPDELGLAGFNRLEIIDGLPMRIATIDSCRREIGALAGRLIACRAGLIEDDELPAGPVIELEPRLERGDTIRPPRRRP
ncbi:MAG: LacI family DNA-binding transcriptional regulator [Alphaproteobacteria bacterium]|nr:MAG: LacI family DNA-binding transcriptional regulator [Alphaproteobacteria bacterium]